MTAGADSIEVTEAAGHRRAGFWLALACFVLLNAVYLFLGGWWVIPVPAIYWAFAHFAELRRLDEFRGGSWAVAELLAGLAWGCCIVIVGIAPGGAVSIDAALLTVGSVAWVVAYAAGEELIWRGFLVAQLDARLGSWWALVLSSAAFALAHGSLDPVELLVYAVDGIVLGAAYLLTRRLWLPIGMHAAINLTVELAYPETVWLVPFIGLQLAVAVVLLVMAGRRGRLGSRRLTAQGARDGSARVQEGW